MKKNFLSIHHYILAKIIYKMKIKYFSDTDTAMLEFRDKDVSETVSIGENIVMDLDENGNLIALTIEHAKEQAGFPFLSFEQIEQNLSVESLADA